MLRRIEQALPKCSSYPRNKKTNEMHSIHGIVLEFHEEDLNFENLPDHQNPSKERTNLMTINEFVRKRCIDIKLANLRYRVASSTTT